MTRVFFTVLTLKYSPLKLCFSSFRWATLCIPRECFPPKSGVDVKLRWRERHQSQLGVTGVFQPILDGVLKYASQATRANAQKHAHVLTGGDVLISKARHCQNTKRIPGAFLEEKPTNQSQQELQNPYRLKGVRACPFPQGKKKFAHVALQVCRAHF